jgi:hypothetical protein
LAQYRILDYGADEVSLRTEDHKLKKTVVTRYTPNNFIKAFADHIPDHYKHAIRHFGLLSPRTKGEMFGAIFVQLGQERRQKPRHLSWAKSIEQDFGRNSLLDSMGEMMAWRKRNASSTTQ